jgi:hypothetical protein
VGAGMRRVQVKIIWGRMDERVIFAAAKSYTTSSR